MQSPCSVILRSLLKAKENRRAVHQSTLRSKGKERTNVGLSVIRN